VQPEGPYRLAGWSFGGVVAYEVATQLIGQDQVVEFVGLFDASTPASWSQKNARGNRSDSPQGRLLQLFNDEELDPRQNKALEELRAMANGMDFEELLRRCRESGLPIILEGYTSGEVQRFAARLNSHMHAYVSYAPKRISVPVHLFVAQEGTSAQVAGAGSDRQLGWDSVLPEQQIERTPVPGHHHSMMSDPHVAVLGQALSKAIAHVAAR
jgi:arthrofactin-type cyclic lipopeptide synthetase C